jgi:hypothetical protein
MELIEVELCGDSRDLVWAVVPGGSQVKGAGPLDWAVPHLRSVKCLGLEKASCGVEPEARKPSGVRIPFPAPTRPRARRLRFKLQFHEYSRHVAPHFVHLKNWVIASSPPRVCTIQ